MKQVYAANDLRHHPIKRFFLEMWWARRELWGLFKRLAMIGLISWGGVKYLTKNGRISIAEGIKARTTEVKNSVNNTQLMKNFYEGTDMIKEGFRTPSPEERAAEQKRMAELRQRQKEFRDECLKHGVDPVMKYVKPGDPEYAQALKDARELFQEHSR